MSRRWMAVLFATFSAATLVSAEERGSDEDREDSEVQIGPRIAPVPLDLENKDLHWVGLGSYMVNSQASCAGCHSAADTLRRRQSLFEAEQAVQHGSYLAGGVPFGPTIASRNITPDSTGKPAGLSGNQFRSDLRR